ncbi:aminotransferase class IV [Frankia sp. QA3]|uniref:aminotransferase class IV n=1 Tax=Frankia sp. QA3 TaxID=710111 RepID=UPI000269CD2B|nr:aminotransferase class IV [Frankia sp. QA3]EIV96102.1 branched-chain amino acid aminotransferase/4-amino-4-deoxychorismate lyase [Frankia sp. QA3]
MTGVASPAFLRVEIDGRPVPLDDPHPLALLPHGHFTVMQVRDGRTRGLGLHLQRLDAANRELYGEPLDGELVRARVRAALAASTRDATVRVVVTGPPEGGPTRLIVAVGAPAEPPAAPQRLMSVPYSRPFPHLKHLGTFGQLQYGRLARRRGFDDALLTGPGGVIAEGATTNIGFLAGDAVVWPDAPALHGVTMALLERSPASSRAPVRLADLARFEAAFVTNSRGIAAVAAVDDHRFAGSTPLIAELARRYEAVPGDLV